MTKGTPDPADVKAEIDALLADLARSEGWLAPVVDAHPPIPSSPKREPLFVHHLPREDRFVGRASELANLRRLYESGRTGMIAIVGIGGAGKSVLLDAFLRTLEGADGLLVWSFYVDEDAERFLSYAYRYVTGTDPPLEDRGRKLAKKLCSALQHAGRIVLVLDGLERAQRDDGRIGVDAIRDVMERLSLGWGRALALVTTRLSLVDLQHYRGDVYQEVRLGELSSADAAALLARAGVLGTDRERAALSARFGGHALTVSLLGTALARFYEGDPARVGEIVGEGVLDLLDETGKLGRVLAYYERQLAPAELGVLQWMTALPRGASVDFLEQFLVDGAGASAPEEIRGLDHAALHTSLARLLGLHLIQADTKGGLTEYGVHAAIKAHFYERMLVASGVLAHEAAYRALDPHRALSARPPRARPVERDELERTEDAIYHVLRLRRAREAYALYRRFFGYEHLGARLGAYVLGERVVRQFFPEGDPARGVAGLDTAQRGFLLTELGLFLRQLGELEKAADCHALVAGMAAPDGEMPAGGLLHLAHDRLLQGSFGEVEWFAEQARKLCGQDREVERVAHLYCVAAYTCLGKLDGARVALEAARRFGGDDLLLVTVRVDLNLRVGRADRAFQIASELRQRLATQGLREEHMACDLLLAECAFALGNVAEALALLMRADSFATQASWQHALCQIHRLRARAALARGEPSVAAEQIEAGLRVAERRGFGSLHIDLLILRGELELGADPASAAAIGRKTFYLATDHACRYRWGQADALDLWGRAVARAGDPGQARLLLKQALRVRRELGNPARTARTEAAIAAL